MKYQTISLQEFSAVKGVNYYLAIAKVIFSRVKNMLFSGVKISCFTQKLTWNITGVCIIRRVYL